MLSSVSLISSQRRAVVTEVKGVWVSAQGTQYLFAFWCERLVFCAGIVVEDCLLLLLNLLKNNSSNQNFFKEGSYIQRMKPWFEVGDDNSGWSAQKVTNLHLMLQVKQNFCICDSASRTAGLVSLFTLLYSQLVRVMVSPVNSPGATASCQKSMYQCGLLQQLCTILMATGVPADILTEVITVLQH